MARHPLLVVATLAALAAAFPAWAGDGDACVTAGAEVERGLNLPTGLLSAIGQVESGRRDAASGRLLPWPWSIDVAGRDEVFADAKAAAARTRDLLGQGTASIDVGCFQINLAAHPNAFATIEEGFDPRSNARAAGGLLMELRERTGSWQQAIAAYHSSTPALGGPYRDRVLTAWGRHLDEVVIATASPSDIPPLGLRVMQWAPACCGMHVWTPSSQPAAHVITLAPGAGQPRIKVATR